MPKISELLADIQLNGIDGISVEKVFNSVIAENEIPLLCDTVRLFPDSFRRQIIQKTPVIACLLQSLASFAEIARILADFGKDEAICNDLTLATQVIFTRSIISRMLSSPYHMSILHLLAVCNIRQFLNDDFIEIFGHFKYECVAQIESNENANEAIEDPKEEQKKLVKGKKMKLIETIYAKVATATANHKFMNFVMNLKTLGILYKNGRFDILKSYFTYKFINHDITRYLVTRLIHPSDIELIMQLLENYPEFIQSFYSTHSDEIFFHFIRLSSSSQALNNVSKWIPIQFTKQYLTKAVLDEERQTEALNALAHATDLGHSDIPAGSTLISLMKSVGSNADFNFSLLKSVLAYHKKGFLEIDAFKWLSGIMTSLDSHSVKIALQILALSTPSNFDSLPDLLAYKSANSESDHSLDDLIVKILSISVLFEGDRKKLRIFAQTLLHQPSEVQEKLINILKKYSNPVQVYNLIDIFGEGKLLKGAFKDYPCIQETIDEDNLAPEVSKDESLEFEEKTVEQIFKEIRDSPEIRDTVLTKMLHTVKEKKMKAGKKDLLGILKKFPNNELALFILSFLLYQNKCIDSETMLKLIMNHSKFSLILEENFLGLVHLIDTLILLDQDLRLPLSLLSELSKGYGGTDSAKDHLLERIFDHVETKLGRSALEFWKFEDITIDPKLMFASTIKFKVYENMDISERKIFTALDHVEGTKYSSKFAMAYIINAISTNSQNLEQMIENNSLSFIFRSLSSLDNRFRDVGYILLGHIMSKFDDPFIEIITEKKPKEQVSKKYLSGANAFTTNTQITFTSGLKQKREIFYILKYLQSVSSDEPIPSMITVFIGHLIRIIRNPSHTLFRNVNKFILSRPVMDSTDIPMFYELFFQTFSDSSKEINLKGTSRIGKRMMLQLLKQVYTPLDLECFKRRKVIHLLSTYPAEFKKDILEIFDAVIDVMINSGQVDFSLLKIMIVSLQIRGWMFPAVEEKIKKIADESTLMLLTDCSRRCLASKRKAEESGDIPIREFRGRK